jgi:transcriptional regulator with XRE-family HTH domain
MMVYLVMDAEQVRSLRKQKGMSQRRLAEVSGVPRKTL